MDLALVSSSNLLLVGLDLALELVNEGLHALIVLPVLVLGVGQLLDVTLRLAEVLLSISKTSVLGIQLRLQFTDASLHLGNSLLTSLESSLLSLIKTVLCILDLGLQKLLVSLEHHSALLFGSEFIRHLGLRSHLIQIVTKSIQFLFTLGLCSIDGLVLAGLVRQVLVGVSKLLFNHSPVPVGLFQKSAGLLQSILVCVASSISSNQVVLGDGLGSGLLLKSGLNLSQTLLDNLDLSLALSIGSVGVLQSSVKVQNISFKLLLHSQSLNLALGLSLQSHLHTLKSFTIVLFGGGKLLLLLGNSLFNLLSDLGQLQLASQDLVLLLLQGSLSLGQSSFKLHLLSLKPLADFVNLMDGAASLSDLVHNVLDLMGQ